MNTIKTVAAFETHDDIERTIDTLVEAGIDPADIAVVTTPEPASAEAFPEAASLEPTEPEGASVLLAVTAPHEDTGLVEDILRDSGEINLKASDTPAVGWSGDPESETLDKRRTPAVGWAGKVERP